MFTFPPRRQTIASRRFVRAHGRPAYTARHSASHATCGPLERETRPLAPTLLLSPAHFSRSSRPSHTVRTVPSATGPIKASLALSPPRYSSRFATCIFLPRLQSDSPRVKRSARSHRAPLRLKSCPGPRYRLNMRFNSGRQKGRSLSSLSQLYILKVGVFFAAGACGPRGFDEPPAE